MLKVELKRYFKSYLNLIIIFFLLLVMFISFSSIYSTYLEWKSQLDFCEKDITTEMIMNILKGYSGITYLTWMLFGTDEIFMLIIVFIVGFSVMFGNNTFNPLHTGFGNKIITREPYKKYFFNTVLSQTIYMCLFIITVIFIPTVIMLSIFPQDWSCSPSNTLGFIFTNNMDLIKIVIKQVLLIIVLVVPLVNLTSVTPLLVTNKYLNMSIPIICVIVAFIAANTLSNISPFLANVLKLFNVPYYMSILYNYNQLIIQNSLDAKQIMEMIFRAVCLPGLISVIFVILYFPNIKRFKRDYLI